MVNKEGIMSTQRKSGSRRPAAIAVAVMMAAAVFAGLPATDFGKVYAAGETAVVATDVLNVRSGAGTNYSRIGALKEGRTFVVTGSAKDSSGVVWYQFSFGSRTGYVSSRYVNIKQPTVTPVSNTQGAVSDGPLRVRSGPGTGYSVLGSLATGKTFTVSGKAQDISGVWWYSFDYNGKTGYVSSQYVKTSSTSSSVVEVEKTTGTVNDGPLRVRTGPGTSYSVLGSLATGKSFTVTGKAQDSSGTWWYRLTYSGKTGYVSSAYVTTKTESGTEEEPEPDTGKKQVGTVFDGPL